MASVVLVRLWSGLHWRWNLRISSGVERTVKEMIFKDLDGDSIHIDQSAYYSNKIFVWSERPGAYLTPKDVRRVIKNLSKWLEER